MTASVHNQAYEKVRTVGNPVVFLSGRGIVNPLRWMDMTDSQAVIGYLADKFLANTPDTEGVCCTYW